MNINLHIERLVLDGLPVGSHEGPLVEAAVAAELTRMFAGGGFGEGTPRGGTRPLVRAEAIRMDGSGGAEGLGKQIGQAVFGGIGK